MKSVKWATLLRESAALQTLLVLALLAAAALAEHHEKHSKTNGDHVEHHRKKNGDHVAHHSGAHGDPAEEYDALDTRLNKLTARLQDIEDELDHRLDPELKSKALSLQHHIEELEEDHCDEDHYDCGPIDHECVSRLFVCDGTKDCRNGDDEKHCDLPTKAGDLFVGSVLHDTCFGSKVDYIAFYVTEVKVNPAYPVYPQITATTRITRRADQDVIAFPAVGHYRFATHSLLMFPPDFHGHGLTCDFDGHDNDRCVGKIVSIGSLVPCAKIIFNRQHDKE